MPSLTRVEVTPDGIEPSRLPLLSTLAAKTSVALSAVLACFAFGTVPSDDSLMSVPLTLLFFKSTDFTLLFLMSSDLTELWPGRATATPPIAANSAIAEITRAGDGRNRLNLMKASSLHGQRPEPPAAR